MEALLAQLATQAFTSPQFWEMLMQSGCHTASDVAQDALDAYEAGYLTKEQARRIVNICLEDQPTQPRQVYQVPSQPVAIGSGDLAALAGQFITHLLK